MINLSALLVGHLLVLSHHLWTRRVVSGSKSKLILLLTKINYRIGQTISLGAFQQMMVKELKDSNVPAAPCKMKALVKVQLMLTRL